VHRALNRTRVCAWIGIKVKHSGTSSNSYAMLAFALAFFGFVAHAQTISPVVVEYQERGEGKFELTNSSLQPLVVVLEPKSFSIAPDGAGMFRPLDPAIHVELSTMSVRLLPKQSYTVFYKAWADSLPQWFTIYASFLRRKDSPVSVCGSCFLIPYIFARRNLCAKRPLWFRMSFSIRTIIALRLTLKITAPGMAGSARRLHRAVANPPISVDSPCCPEVCVMLQSLGRRIRLRNNFSCDLTRSI
jgi:hypothetical protein